MSVAPIRNALRCALGLALAGCASDLDDPERFAFLLGPDGGDSPLAGSGGSGAQPGAAPPPCVTQLFENSCGSLGCHGEGAVFLDLVSEGVAERLVDQPALATGACAGEVYVETGGESLLLDKIQPMPSCGERMPYTSPALEAAEVQCLTDWVVELGGSGEP